MTARPLSAAAAAFVLALALAASAATAAETLAGKLLVAAPSMPDGYFSHSVVFMLQHDETGAMGVVVNIPIGALPFTNLFDALGVEPEIDDDLAERTVRIYSGGPVDAGQGFVLHSEDYLDDSNRDDAIIGAGGLTLSMSVELVRAMASGEGPAKSLLLFGYAGWAPGQLETELKRDDWITVKADESLVFDSDDGSKWRRAMDSLKIDL